MDGEDISNLRFISKVVNIFTLYTVLFPIIPKLIIYRRQYTKSHRKWIRL